MVSENVNAAQTFQQNLNVHSLEKTWIPKQHFFQTVDGAIDCNGEPYICKNHIHYFQIQTGMAVCGLKQCDFVVFTEKGIFMANIEFNEDFWKSTIRAVSELFYSEQIFTTLLLQLASNMSNNC